MLCRLPERLQEVGGEGKGTGGLGWDGGLCLWGTNLHPISKHFLWERKTLTNNAVQQFFGSLFFFIPPPFAPPPLESPLYNLPFL